MSGQRAESLIDVDDSAFLSSLKDAFAEMEITNEGQLVKVATEVTNKAKLYCPVDTGRLRASIIAQPLEHDGEGAYVDVGTSVEYSVPVEFGTYKMRPQSFMRPALAEVTGGDFATRSGPPEIQG